MSLLHGWEKWSSAVHKALRAWHLPSHGKATSLLDAWWVVRECRQEVPEEHPTGMRWAVNEVLLSGLEKMAQQDAYKARILRARFIDKRTVAEAARLFNVSRDSLNRQQREAIELLTQFLWADEVAARERRIQLLERRLQAASYTELFGFEEASRRLVEKLLAPEGHWLTTIVGLGGIGKTALADFVTREVIRELHFEEVIWIKVEAVGMCEANLTLEGLWDALAAELWAEESSSLSPNQRARRVRDALKSKAHLIVIDNLEAEAETSYLLSHLGELANPSKFLLTTRTNPLGQAGEAPVFVLSLSELSNADGMALLCHRAAEIGLHELANGPREQSEKIIEIVGGNPLALKLVVSLAMVLPLPHILADLKSARLKHIEEMYRRIYWKAWQTLSAEARDLLQAMPLISHTGALPEQMQAMSELTEAQLWPAITELVSRSLLEVQGTLWDRRYGIHRLTETFLRNDIIFWPEEEA